MNKKYFFVFLMVLVVALSCTKQAQPIVKSSEISNEKAAENAAEQPKENAKVPPKDETKNSTVTETKPSIKEFTVEADDYGFYPGAPLIVAPGSQIKIAFIVRTTNVYYGGLDFRSSKFQTVAAKPGDSATVEFTADSSFTITSYWPSSGVKKADLKVMVQ